MARKFTREEKVRIREEYTSLAGDYIDAILDMRVEDSIKIWKLMIEVLPIDVITQFSNELYDNDELSEEFERLTSEVGDKVFDEMFKDEDEKDDDDED